MNRVSRSALFYLLGFYILLQFAWWAYTLVDLNAEIYHLKLQLLQQSNLPVPELQILKGELDRKLSLRIWMVLGEGSVFVIMLLFGFRAVKKSIEQQLSLADQQKNFLLSVTHELKSPLASIKLQLQTLLSRELPKQKAEQLYQRALNDTDRLEKLVETLLLVNKMESGDLPLHLVEMDLFEVVEQTLDNHYPQQIEAGIIRLAQAEPVRVQADHMALQSIILNLVDNAIKYGNGSVVFVSVARDSGSAHAVLTVSDNGPGVPHEQKSRVFERFYRIGNEEVRSTKGTGLGLYLVKLLVQSHGGSVHVSDNEPKGAEFVVTLPQTAT